MKRRRRRVKNSFNIFGWRRAENGKLLLGAIDNMCFIHRPIQRIVKSTCGWGNIGYNMYVNFYARKQKICHCYTTSIWGWYEHRMPDAHAFQASTVIKRKKKHTLRKRRWREFHINIYIKKNVLRLGSSYWCCGSSEFANVQ